MIVQRSRTGEIKVEMTNFNKSQKVVEMINQKRVFRTKLKLNELKKKQSIRQRGHNGKLKEKKSQLS